MSEGLFIHKLKCPECNAYARADRPVGCWDCGQEMEIYKRQIATINYE